MSAAEEVIPPKTAEKAVAPKKRDRQIQRLQGELTDLKERVATVAYNAFNVNALEMSAQLKRILNIDRAVKPRKKRP